MGNLTAFLIVRNEELLLPCCLSSLAGVVDAVVVLDTGSRDGTQDILTRATADPTLPPLLWESHPFVDFGQARRAALARVETEWALWIDGDEFLSDPLRERLRQLRAAGTWEDYDACMVPLENRVYGRVMRGRNLSGQFRTRIFRSHLGIITSSAVHEGLHLPPTCRTLRLTEPLVHDTLINWRRYLVKVDLYTDLEAATMPHRHPLYLLAHLLVTVPATMWREYVWRTGFRDGWPGFVWAATTAWSSLLRDFKLLRRSARHSLAAGPDC